MISRDRSLLALAASLVALLAIEAGFRLLEARLGVDRQRLERFRDFAWTGGEATDYVPRAHVLYTRTPNSPGVNSLGFTDDLSWTSMRSRAPVRRGCTPRFWTSFT